MSFKVCEHTHTHFSTEHYLTIKFSSAHLHQSYISLNYITILLAHGTPLSKPVARPHSKNINFQLYPGQRQTTSFFGLEINK